MDLFGIPPSLLLDIRKVSRRGAETLLEPYRAKLSPTEYEKYLSFSRPDDLPAESYVVRTNSPSRRKFIAAAWIVGASFRQIGELWGSSRQTVMDAVARVLPSGERDVTPRMHASPIPQELLRVMWQVWQEDSMLAEMAPHAAAQVIFTRAGERL